jgi:glycogenin
MKAFVTVLSNDKYLDGVIVLAKSLKAVNTIYPLYCLSSSGVSKNAERYLEQNGISILKIEAQTLSNEANGDGQEFSHWNYTFDKLQVWGLTQFEKIVFLDSDMLILRNLDSLFDKPAFAAVCAGKSYPTHKDWKELNSGIIVIDPDNTVKQSLIDLVAPVVSEFKRKGVPVGDQDVIHKFIPDWPSDTSLHLDEGYNILADYLTYYIRQEGYSLKNTAGKPIYVIHFIGRTKPWMKKSLRNWAWFIKMCLTNPYYYWAYKKYRSYL